MPLESAAELADLVRLYAPVVDSAWHLRRYPDLECWVGTATEHFVLHGEQEGRDPSPAVNTEFLRHEFGDALGYDARPLRAFLDAPLSPHLRPSPCVDIAYVVGHRPRIRTPHDLLTALNDGSLSEWSEWFSPAEYLELHPDIHGVMAPSEHFLLHGIYEGRSPRARYQVVEANQADDGPLAAQRVIDSFQWRGVDWVVLAVGPGDSVLAQIEQQGSIDSRVWAPGAPAVPGLPLYDATDLATRMGIDVAGMLELAQDPADLVIVMPMLGIGGSEKYLSQFARHCADTYGWSVTLLVTESTAEALELDVARLRERQLRGVRVVAYRDFGGRAWNPEFVLALLLVSMQPKLVLVSNSELGFRTVVRHGKGLSNVTTMVGCFFSESPRAVGAPYAVRYADLVVDHAHLLSDNGVVYDTIGRRIGGDEARRRMHVLPQQVDLRDAQRDERDATMRAGRRRNNRPLQLLWVSRWEPFKNTRALQLAAELMASVTITAMGPGTESAPDDRPSNLRVGPAVPHVDAIDLAEYDAFLFTSRFEGMPNTVLEMVMRGVPVMTPRVGGLTETFDDDALWFYDNGDTDAQTAANIARRVDDFRAAIEDEVHARVARARAQAEVRHAAAAYTREVSELFTAIGLGGGDA